MGHFIKASLIAIGVVTVGLLCLRPFSGNGENTLSAAGSSLLGQPEQVLAYHPSDEEIDPYKIAKNPYVLEGHSGILDPRRVAMFLPDGRRIALNYPPSSLQFEKMINENTATYKVLSGVDTYGEIAVSLESSNPPDATKPWRVLVEGPMEGLNALGASLTVTRVRFKGYYEPSAAQLQSTPEAEVTLESDGSTSSQENAPSNVSAPKTTDSDDASDTQHPK